MDPSSHFKRNDTTAVGGEWRGELSYSRYNLLLAVFSRERNEMYVARANFSFVFRVEEYVGVRILILKIPPAIDT